MKSLPYIVLGLFCFSLAAGDTHNFPSEKRLRHSVKKAIEHRIDVVNAKYSNPGFKLTELDLHRTKDPGKWVMCLGNKDKCIDAYFTIAEQEGDIRHYKYYFYTCILKYNRSIFKLCNCSVQNPKSDTREFYDQDREFMAIARQRYKGLFSIYLEGPIIYDDTNESNRP